MSLSEPPQGRGSPPPPPPSYPFGPEGGEPSRFPVPTLPPMSSLFRREPEQQPIQTNPYIARQFQPPYNMIKQHPLYLSEMDPNAPNQAESMLVPATGHHTLALAQSHAPPPQQRQFKKIVQRQQTSDSSKLPNERRSASSSRQKSRSPPREPEASGSRQEFTISGPARQMSSQSQSSRSMPISGLLSDGPSAAPERPKPIFSIRMRQQPLAARACGFGERDRRVIDPPPILQMDVDAPNATPEERKALIRQPYAVVHCTLWDPVNDRDDTAMPGTTDKRQQRRLMGTLVASPFVGNDENDVEGCFFCFPDLSVRTPGTYSLRFKLVNLDVTRMRPGHTEPVRSTAMSDPFNVYNAKDFGGMRASTELTKRLKHQGCLISVKKGNAKSNGKNERDDDDDDIDDDENDLEEGSTARKGPKRIKR